MPSLKKFDLPANHPPDIVWLCLTWVKARIFTVSGRVYRFRVPAVLKEGHWSCSEPVPRSVAAELINEVDHVAQRPNGEGRVPDSSLRQVHIFEQTSHPPDWRKKLRAAGWVLGASAADQAGAEELKDSGIDKGAVKALVKMEMEKAGLEKARAAIKAGMEPDTVRTCVELGVFPEAILDELQAVGSQPFLEGMLAQSWRDAVASIGDVTDKKQLESLRKIEEKRSSPRTSVINAITARELALSGHPDTEHPRAATDVDALEP